MFTKTKRGLSPVIASVMLITIALVLAVIIFLWAKSWIGENIQKDLGGGPEAIESFCDDIQFVAEADSSGTITLNNIGNVPIYGVEIKLKQGGSIENIGSGIFGNGIPKGSTGETTISLGGASVGEEILLVPVILGETNEYKKPYVCDEKFGETITIIA